MRCSRLLRVAVLLAVLPAARQACADEIVADGFPYQFATILGIRGDKLVFSLNGREVQADLAKVTKVNIDKAPKFNQAEGMRDSDPKKAAALYKDALQSEVTGKVLRPVAQLRAIAPTDADGRYTEALALFLAVYQQSPTDTLWAMRPTHLPAAGSTMLKEAAELIGTKLSGFSNDEAKKNLQLLQVDLYTKSGDTKSAARLARQINGAPATPEPGDAPAGNTAAPAEITPADLAPLEDAIKSNNYSGALTLADRLLERANGEGAVQVFLAKARAYAGNRQPELAAATYLRVPIHYPKSPSAPAALFQAAELQKSLNHPDEAARLYKEIVEKYPDSPEAVKAPH
jgi:tetratricopeptide (TPR) repeat protein